MVMVISDLAAGNVNASPRIYLNNRGRLTSAAFWESQGEQNAALALVWGDVDNDGDSISYRAMPMHRMYFMNSANLLQGEPHWSSEKQELTSSTAWGDVDGDGDLDIRAVGNWGFNTLYLNHEGRDSRNPDWQSVEGEATHDVDGVMLTATAILIGNGHGDNIAIYLNQSGVLAAKCILAKRRPYKCKASPGETSIRMATSIWQLVAIWFISYLNDGA
ncbi:MAG: hypothetical protein R2873_04540 [Caldilineaceae bacterium]